MRLYCARTRSSQTESSRRLSRIASALVAKALTSTFCPWPRPRARIPVTSESKWREGEETLGVIIGSAWGSEHSDAQGFSPPG